MDRPQTSVRACSQIWDADSFVLSKLVCIALRLGKKTVQLAILVGTCPPTHKAKQLLVIARYGTLRLCAYSNVRSK